ncbi:MAG: flagellar basal body-associated FliL family protein [Alphaproteobacteria bacterium]
MAEKTKDEEREDSAAPEGAEGEEKPQKRRLAGKKIILFIVLPVLLIVGGALGAYLGGVFGSHEPNPEELAAAEAKAKASRPPPTFFELPDIVVNLTSAGRKSNFLKLNVSLEIENAEDGHKLKALQPRIVDSFQIYLRDLRVEDLQGSEGIYRVREELLRRVNAAAEPVKVSDVLFRELLIQ